MTKAHVIKLEGITKYLVVKISLKAAGKKLNLILHFVLS